MAGAEPISRPWHGEAYPPSLQARIHHGRQGTSDSGSSGKSQGSDTIFRYSPDAELPAPPPLPPPRTQSPPSFLYAVPFPPVPPVRQECAVCRNRLYDRVEHFCPGARHGEHDRRRAAPAQTHWRPEPGILHDGMAGHRHHLHRESEAPRPTPSPRGLHSPPEPPAFSASPFHRPRLSYLP